MLGLNSNQIIFKGYSIKKVFLTAIFALGLIGVANANEAVERMQQERIAPIVAWGIKQGVMWGIRYTIWGAFNERHPINSGVGTHGWRW